MSFTLLRKFCKVFNSILVSSILSFVRVIQCTCSSSLKTNSYQLSKWQDICQLEWNFMQTSMYVYESVNFISVKLAFLWTVSRFHPFKIFLPRLVACHLFLCCQYRFSLQYAKVLWLLENYTRWSACYLLQPSALTTLASVSVKEWRKLMFCSWAPC